MPRAKTTRILFIGNSFTHRNDLPSQLARLGETAKINVEHHLLSINGASLRNHWNKGDAQKLIATGGWDYVVLQEQSTLPVKNAVRMAENVRLFDAVVKQAGAKVVLYLTWSRRHEPANQAAITTAYRSIGKEIGATVVPVGVVWQQFARKHPSPDLWDKDNSHPSPAGTYLAACVFAKTLLGVTTSDPSSKIDTDDARLIASFVKSAK